MEQRRRIAFPLLTPRFVVRPMRDDDAGELHEVYGDPTSMRFLTSELPASETQASGSSGSTAWWV